MQTDLTTTQFQNEEFDPLDPKQQQSRWEAELSAAEKEVESFQKEGDRAVQRFRDDRRATREDVNRSIDRRWNLFWSGTTTKLCLLYGQIPKVDVERRFSDSADDVARVASEMIQRLLNCEIETGEDGSALAFGNALIDWVIPGLGNVRARYEVKTEVIEATAAMLDANGNVLAEAVPEQERKVSESVVMEYVHWKDQLCSAGSRTYQEWRWWGHRNQMSRADLHARFDEVLTPEIVSTIPLNAKRGTSTNGDSDAQRHDPWGRADVWEIWDKETKNVYWVVRGFNRVLDVKPDPLGLKNFWPCPRPLAANVVTDTTVPTSDFHLVRDLYDEINDLTTRVVQLQQALAVRGVYDQALGQSVERLLTETSNKQNELIPVQNYAAFREKGGMDGVIQWLPLGEVISTLRELVTYRSEVVQALFQISGMSDIMRGQAQGDGPATATEQSIKAKFGSVRMQTAQREFARFCSDAARLKAEIICKHFDPETIIEKSNIMMTPDARLAEQAVQLLKKQYGLYRISVKPESVALSDFAAMQSEAGAFVQGISSFLSASAPLAQAAPESKPFLMQLLGLVMSRFQFAQQAEGIVDQAIAAAQKAEAQKASQPPPPDPKLMATQAKAQLDQQKAMLDAKLQQQQAALEIEAEAAKQQNQTKWNLIEAQGHAAIDLQKERLRPQPIPSPPRPLR